MTVDFSPVPKRQFWMGLLARAEPEVLVQHLQQVEPLPSFTVLRRPETGLSMVRGRVGADGEAFNFIEATLTRASVTDQNGYTGHSYILGRNEEHAVVAARLDAALQNATLRAGLMTMVIEPLQTLETARHAAIEARAAETEVRFFTMATGRL
ncbi:phosphonate C-P lyase system protein PhnG [Gluconobacter sp. LMG 1744]|uniref:phosphonate C-P lyase system protein PhnG n=1 Tax=Gluconobacter TaxID=441 RepID=UPI00188553A0|nr:phosphonate C-P lyase system protein PhnG [Gluconobacter cadivus]MBF0891898.1 phosphonate C-P lyase system protein PhnG [Gluconobacter cadivus]